MSLQNVLGTELSLNTTYHPQTDGQYERTIQIIQDMLHSCILHFGSNWDNHLLVVEFACYNGYQASNNMVPYEALYERPTRSPLLV